MTSVLNVDTIADKAGTGPVGLTKQNGAKCFACADNAGVVFSPSLNIASSVDNGTGDYSHTFTNVFSTSVDEGQGIGVVASGGASGARLATSDTTSAVINIHTENFSDGSNADRKHHFIICGDLS